MPHLRGAIRKPIASRAVEPPAQLVESRRGTALQQLDHLSVFARRLRQDATNGIFFAELAINVAFNLLEFAFLGFNVEAQIRRLIKRFTNIRQLVPTRISKLFEDLGGPLDVI